MDSCRHGRRLPLSRSGWGRASDQRSRTHRWQNNPESLERIHGVTASRACCPRGDYGGPSLVRSAASLGATVITTAGRMLLSFAPRVRRSNGLGSGIRPPGIPTARTLTGMWFATRVGCRRRGRRSNRRRRAIVRRTRWFCSSRPECRSRPVAIERVFFSEAAAPLIAKTRVSSRARSLPVRSAGRRRTPLRCSVVAS